MICSMQTLERTVVFVQKEENSKLKKQKKKAQKPKYNMWQNSWFMISLAWKTKEKKVLGLCILSALFAVLSNLIELYIAPTILGAVERKTSISELLLTIGLFVGAMMLVAAGAAYVNANTMFGRLAVRRTIMASLNKKAMTTSYPNVNDDIFIKLLNQSNDACSYDDTPAQAIWRTLTALLQNILGFIIYVNLLTSVQPLLLLVILSTAIIGYLINNYAGSYAYRHREKRADYVRQVRYVSGLSGNWSAAKDIRIFHLRPWLDELYEKSIRAYDTFHNKAQNVQMWAGFVDIVFTFLRNGIAYAYLIHQVLSGRLSAAEFLLFFSAAGGFTKWISGILENMNTLHRQSLDISNIRECLEYPEPFAFEDGIPLVSEPSKTYEIRLENVSFRYPGSDHDVLTNINLTLHPGEKLAVVGLNGAGKTTLVNLICGFLDPTQGHVLLNNMDIRTYNRRDYYKFFSAVFQSFSIFAGSITTNIIQADQNLQLELVENCLKKAGLKEKIASLPNGCNTNLNRTVYDDAIMLSGGETQRLMLARALYKNAPFVILDEPTAALDPIAEADMYQKYHQMTAGKSSVYISHRLASTRFCDRIIFLENTGISEEGTHEELLLMNGRYAEIYAVQSKYYQEGDGTDEPK